MPEVETWTFNPIERGDGDIRRLGINFGAPGDRRAENGTLWLDYPSHGGSSPAVEIETTPEHPTWFTRHSSRIEKGVLTWVEASGAKGIKDISIKLTSSGKKKVESDEAGAEKRYTVRLHFAEPDGKAQGQRVFDISINGKTVLKDFDIVKEGGAPNIGIVKEFTVVQASDTMRISLKPRRRGSKTVICGIELIAE
jgi:hypothetical protein